MAPDSLHRESVLVLFVDLAEGPLSSVGSIPQAELRTNAGAMAELCRLLDLPVVLARAPLPGTAGTLLPEVAAHAEGFTRVEHATNDSWETPGFVDAVRATGRRQLVFAGIATDVGVGLTALSAVRAGYQVAVLTDVSGTIHVRAEQTAWLRLAQAGVILTTWSGFAGEEQRTCTGMAGAHQEVR
jgi:nicotinamidase-related amidase